VVHPAMVVLTLPTPHALGWNERRALRRRKHLC
jgi:hypothetical protein